MPRANRVHTDNKCAPRGPGKPETEFDHLGSVAAVSDESHAVVERFSFDVWGKRRNSTGWGYAEQGIRVIEANSRAKTIWPRRRQPL